MNSKYLSEKKRAISRLKIIKGQVEGLVRMVEEDKYCMDILNQSLAIQNSLKSFDSLIFHRHLETHVAMQFAHESHKAVGELVDIFKRVSKT